MRMTVPIAHSVGPQVAHHIVAWHVLSFMKNFHKATGWRNPKTVMMRCKCSVFSTSFCISSCCIFLLPFFLPYQLWANEAMLEGPAIWETPFLPNLCPAQPDAGGQEGNAVYTLSEEGKKKKMSCSYHLRVSLSIFQAYVNMALFENFTYAGIDATAEEAWLPAPPDPSRQRSPKRKPRGWSPRYCHLPAGQHHGRRIRRPTKDTQL